MKKFARLTKNYNKFSFLFTTNQVLSEKTRLLCALSGGQDSIVTFFILFHLLSISKQLYKKDTFLYGLVPKGEPHLISLSQKLFAQKKGNKTIKLPRIEIVYCHHFWQPKNFFCSEFIFQLSFLVHIPYTLILPKTILASENRSREWRKKNFYRFLELEKIATLVTGLTKSDTLEKNLTNLFRGTSPKSLSKDFIFYSKKTSTMFFCFLIFKPIIFSFSLRKRKQSADMFLFYSEKNTKNFCLATKENRFNSFCSQKQVGQKNFVFLKGTKTNFLNRKMYFQNKALTRLNIKFNFSRSCFFKKKVVDPKNFVFKKSSKNKIWPQKILFTPFPQNAVLRTKKLLGIQRKITTSIFEEKRVPSSIFLKKTQILEIIQFDFFDSHSQKEPFCEERFKMYKFNSKIFVFFPKYLRSGSFCFSTKNLKNQKLSLQPLQNLSRSSVSKFVNLYKFPISSDITNFYATFSRNKIRHHFIPFIRFLFQIKFEIFLTKFFCLVGDEHKKVKYDVFELKMVLKFIKMKSVKEILQISLSITLISQIEVSIKSSFLQTSIFNYKELELNYGQISQLKTFIH